MNSTYAIRITIKRIPLYLGHDNTLIGVFDPQTCREFTDLTAATSMALQVQGLYRKGNVEIVEGAGTISEQCVVRINTWDACGSRR